MNHAAPKSAKQVRPLAILNARLLDPASERDERGGVLVQDGLIADVGPQVKAQGLSEDVERIDAGGHCLAPGLVDMRVQLREPGEEHKETIATGSARRGGRRRHQHGVPAQHRSRRSTTSPASSSSRGARARRGSARSTATARSPRISPARTWSRSGC